ncbi:hypothetical protein DKX38_025912 [Salix brachista]|uniref:Uncharacterized protein n=1 Tax=Salix brachista TaxID=2182728 RepID=A0A5N5JVG7_9ROSI|nr:hypothetical protein DKX38_025912 [Salix brachista]
MSRKRCFHRGQIQREKTNVEDSNFCVIYSTVLQSSLDPALPEKEEAEKQDKLLSNQHHSFVFLASFELTFLVQNRFNMANIAEPQQNSTIAVESW